MIPAWLKYKKLILRSNQAVIGGRDLAVSLSEIVFFPTEWA